MYILFPFSVEYIRRVLRALSLRTQPLIPFLHLPTLRHTLRVLPESIPVPVKGPLPSCLYSIVHSYLNWSCPPSIWQLPWALLDPVLDVCKDIKGMGACGHVTITNIPLKVARYYPTMSNYQTMVSRHYKASTSYLSTVEATLKVCIWVVTGLRPRMV